MILIRILLFLAIFFFASSLFATELKGTVVDASGEPLMGVNVYLKGTYSGGTTDMEGNFQFTADETGDQVLIASMVGFQSFEKSINLDNHPASFEITMKEEVNKLNAVVITV